MVSVMTLTLITAITLSVMMLSVALFIVVLNVVAPSFFNFIVFLSIGDVTHFLCC
jgi:hypothetical protein